MMSVVRYLTDQKLPTGTATVTFAITGKSAPLPLNEPILNVADEFGVDIDNACRSGTCGSCKVKLLSGSVTMECEDALTSEEKAQGVILACQAKSTSDVEVDVFQVPSQTSPRGAVSESE